jgi:hypothetical protein
MFQGRQGGEVGLTGLGLQYQRSMVKAVEDALSSDQGKEGSFDSLIEQEVKRLQISQEQIRKEQIRGMGKGTDKEGADKEGLTNVAGAGKVTQSGEKDQGTQGVSTTSDGKKGGASTTSSTTSSTIGNAIQAKSQAAAANVDRELKRKLESAWCTNVVGAISAKVGRAAEQMKREASSLLAQHVRKTEEKLSILRICILPIGYKAIKFSHALLT